MSTNEIRLKIFELLNPLGFECYPFKIGWYNAKVSESFRLIHADDTLAFIIISIPEMFDKAFKPFICRRECLGVRDPIDECIEQQFVQVKQMFPSASIEGIHDFELHHSRQPKILVQTAGHVAGAAYYYQRSDVTSDPWTDSQKIYGVSVHPRYGGWFALRGVLIFKDVLVPDLIQTSPPDVLRDNESRIDLLERFNFHWQDYTFRDVIEPISRYSEEQKEYFSTPPPHRTQLLQHLIASQTVTMSP